MDLRKCKRCGYQGELDDFQALGTKKRYELCNSCWQEVRRNKYSEITVNMAGNDYEYMSFSLSSTDFDTMLSNLQQTVGFSDEMKEAIRSGGIIPYMQRADHTNIVFRR